MQCETTHAVISAISVRILTLSIQAVLVFQKYRFDSGLLLGAMLATVNWYESAARLKGLPRSRLALNLIATGAAATTLALQQAVHVLAR